ncbi:MAG: PIN domain-containing protein [Myxococcales bacterium]|nr:PIN domain-containing protein [Myxococcales bacterium]
MGRPVVADTGGLLRALARRPDGAPAWPEYARALREASRVIVPSLVLAEVDYFLREHRPAMRTLIGELFDPETSYEFEPTTPADLARAMAIDEKFHSLELGLVDSLVATIAERRRVHRVLTIDRADFTALRVGERFQQRLEVVPQGANW